MHPRKRYSFQQRNIKSELSVKETNKLHGKQKASTTAVRQYSIESIEKEQYSKVLSHMSEFGKEKYQNEKTGIKERSYKTKYFRYKSSMSTQKEKTVTQSMSTEEEYFFGKVRECEEKFV